MPQVTTSICIWRKKPSLGLSFTPLLDLLWPKVQMKVNLLKDLNYKLNSNAGQHILIHQSKLNPMRKRQVKWNQFREVNRLEKKKKIQVQNPNIPEKPSKGNIPPIMSPYAEYQLRMKSWKVTFSKWWRKFHKPNCSLFHL